jgi:hypothetical protein
MTAKIHRVLVALGGFLSAVGGVLAAPGYATLGISDEVGVGIVLAGAITTLGATYFRQATDPEAV